MLHFLLLLRIAVLRDTVERAPTKINRANGFCWAYHLSGLTLRRQDVVEAHVRPFVEPLPHGRLRARLVDADPAVTDRHDGIKVEASHVRVARPVATASPRVRIHGSWTVQASPRIYSGMAVTLIFHCPARTVAVFLVTGHSTWPKPTRPMRRLLTRLRAVEFISTRSWNGGIVK